MYDDVTTRNESGELAVRTVSATEGSNTSSYDDVFTRTTDGKLAMRVVGNGGGGGGAVSSVNGKTGAVVLNAEDVGALPEDTPIPDPQVQSDWDQTDPEAVDYIKNKPVIPQGGIPQYDTMPTASAGNVGEIAQYSGESIADSYQNGYFYKSSTEYSDPSATISQTVGSSLTDLSVNVDTFVEAEQPTQDENVGFVANVVPDTSVVVDATAGLDYTFDGQTVIGYFNSIWGYHSPNMDEYVWGITYVVYTNSGWVLSRNQDGSNQWSIALPNGITINSTPNLGDYIAINSTIGSTTWSKNGTTVDLADYGISYSGTAVNGDTLTVAYTAPAPIGYYWNQINVQPSSGGASAGIEWQEPIVMTKPAGDNDYLAPYVHLGSESGSYSFYVKVLRLVEGYGGQVGNSALGYLVYKISFDYDSTNADFTMAISRGGIGLVFDGDMQSQFSNDNPIKYSAGVRLKKVQDGTLWVSVLTALQSDAFLYMNDGATEKVAQFSKVYKDGEIINAECFVDKDYFWENIGSDIWADFSRSPLVEIPAHYYRTYGGWSDSDMNSNTQLMIGGGYDATEIYVSAESGEDRFVGKLYRKNANDWEQEILMASGNFALWEFKKSGTTPIIYFGETPPTFTENVYVSAGAFGVGNINQIQLDFDTSVTTSVPMVRDGKSYRFLTPTASMIGGVHQYVGPTNANYTNGYYYKANGTVVVVPASITTNVTSPAGEATVTIDANNFVNALNQWYGWSKEQIIQWFKDFWSGWNLHYDIANDNIDRLDLPWQGDLTESSILQYVSVTYTGTETTDITIIFDETYAPESKAVQNPSWDRVDVQPLDLTGVAGYDATKTQVLKHVQGTLTWVDE